MIGTRKVFENVVPADNDVLQIEDKIKSCSDSEFSANCIKWLQLCCKSEKSNIVRGGVEDSSLPLFSKIIVMSSKFPELVRPIGSTVTPRFGDLLMENWLDNQNAWEAMKILMTFYSGSLACLKEKLSSYMMDCLRTPTPIPLFKLNCLALLPSIGGGGTRGTIHKSNWHAQMSKLIVTAHHILGLLCRNIEEFHNYPNQSDPELTFPVGANYDNLAVHYSNVLGAIECMLLSQYPVAKMVPAGRLLKLIERVVSSAACGGDLVDIAPALQQSTLKMFSALIVSCGCSLLPSASTIAHYLMQSLLESSANVSVRVTVYGTMSNWITITGAGCCFQDHAKDLVPILLNDLEKSHSLPKDRRKKGDENRNKLEFFLRDELVMVAAVETLNLLINSVGFKLGAEHHKAIQSCVVRNLSSKQHIHGFSGRFRASLYQLLLQLCMEPNPEWPPPTQFALHLFRVGLHDFDPSVVSICARANSAVERIIHPEFSVARFPVDYLKVAEKIERLNEAEEVNEVELNIETYSEPSQRPVTKLSSPWEVASGKNSINRGKSFMEVEPVEETEHPEELEGDFQRQHVQNEEVEVIEHIEEIQLTEEAKETQNGHAAMESKGNSYEICNTDKITILSENSEGSCGHAENPQMDEDPSSENKNSSETQGISNGHKKSRTRLTGKLEVTTTDVSSPMCLRSGTMVCSSLRSNESPPSPRSGNIFKSPSSESKRTRNSSSSSSPCASDVEHVINLFDDTINPNLKKI